VKGREIQVEVERASDPCGERCQDLDLPRVLARRSQHDASRMGSDREQQDGASGQLLGPLQDRPGAVAPAKGWQREVVARQHGRAEIEASARGEDDLGTLERHGGPWCPPRECSASIAPEAR
jgi:hypothetical protein